MRSVFLEKKEEYIFVIFCESECFVSIGSDHIFIFLIFQIKHDKLAVAAIDFGTTYSGFAYCTRHDYEDYLKNKRDQPKIQCPTWKAGGWMNYKAPTCVLFKPNRSFHTFGYDAQSYYQENPDKVDFSQWYYFEHFKMMLYKEKVCRNMYNHKSINL